MSDNPLSFLSQDQIDALLKLVSPTQAKPCVVSPKMIPVCIEHDIDLIDGRCDKCRDDNGNTFVLDMQSYYLRAQTPTLNNLYWKVTDGYFETVVDGRDAQSAEIAFDKAQDVLQPWYFVGHHGELAGSSVAITRKEYIEWLRR